MRKNKETAALSEAQRRLVDENLGLVAVHLRRHVPNLAEPRRDREWDDLFQEGCLGLAAAAARYKPERGIPFPAFALPRIHNAVSKALQTRFTTIYVPPRRNRSCKDASADGTSNPRLRGGAGQAPAENEAPLRSIPKVIGLTEDVERGLADRGSPSNRSESSCDTVGRRLREKYEHAVRVAADFLAGQPSTRGDRAELVRCLVRERLLVPQPEEKRALRQIARDTSSSYARVAQCEKQLTTFVGRILEADPEFHALLQIARGQPDGCDYAVDDIVEAQLRSASTDEFLRRFRRADSSTRAHLLHNVLRLSQARTERIVLSFFARLSHRCRAQIFQDTAPLAADGACGNATPRQGARRDPQPAV